MHPVEAPPPPDPAEQPRGVLMKDLPGMPGTAGGLGLRLAQFAFAAVALAVMASTNDFPSVTSFWCVPRVPPLSPPPSLFLFPLYPLHVSIEVSSFRI